MTPRRHGRVNGRFRHPWAVGAAWCVALILTQGVSPATAADPEPLTALLLIARDDLTDSDFTDSVVLVMNNLAPAPIGIIVNRPTAIPVSRLFPELKALARRHDKLYFGGPVELDSVWFLFRATKPPENAVRAFADVYLSADRRLLRQLLARRDPMDGLRLFIGHAGWGPGQLEIEIGRGDWTLKAATSEAIFHGKSEHPWPATEQLPRT